MRPEFTALLLGLAALTAGLGASQPQALSPAAKTPEDFSASVRGLDAELGLLDGGSLTQALRKLAGEGRPLRLLLDPSSAATRREGAALAALTPSTQVRWKKGAGRPLRRLLSHDGGLLVWKAWAPPERADGVRPQALQRFEQDWVLASSELPEDLNLEDELKRLPDPSVNEPHIIRRREAGASEEGHEDPTDTR